MATYSIASGDIAVHEKSLAAGVEDVVNFAEDISDVEVLVHSGSAPVYFTVDRAATAVAGPRTVAVMPSSAVQVQVWTRGASQVRLISSASAVYSVTKV